MIVGNGGTTGTLGSGTITNNSHIVFNRSDTAPIISQTIQGIGDVVQNGTGTLTFSGDNTYTGNTAVNAGRLNITGSVDTPNITVESGAILDLSLLKYSFGATGVVYNTVVEAGITYEISILPSLPSIIKLPNIINNGGTVIMPPDIEYYIVGGGGPGYSVSYGGGGGGGQVLQNTIALPLLKVDRTLIVGARGTTKNQNGFKSQLFSLIATPGFANSQAGNSSYARGGRANGVAGVVLEQRGANGIAPADASIKTALAGYFGIAETSVLLGAGGGGGSFFSGKRAGGVYGGGTGGKNGASTSAVLNTGAGGGGGGGTATAGGFGGSGLIVIKKIKY
ncbi:autotransporter-associated beta strand repeat-containing protein [Frigoriflavimonas asaccharolytica]|uniref:Autotransporter-associated beta strand protein n=1 Tax=Frigoriflavimonas asaccharolytica TaxID=2735899 RepID=A0A8J8GC98_9FLAO|nr:autotransporter-associated beta strand repeat-containing protein [Frigoriflavimonas asaccharolytica]NRS93584.1 autotransporter-associated beta strand protein [Frigoriflavimonas asaccharolytica]